MDAVLPGSVPAGFFDGIELTRAQCRHGLHALPQREGGAHDAARCRRRRQRHRAPRARRDGAMARRRLIEQIGTGRNEHVRNAHGCRTRIGLVARARRTGCRRAKSRRALRQGQGGRGARPLYRRAGRAVGGVRQGFFRALSRHRRHGQWRLQQRARPQDRRAAQEQEARGRYRRACRRCRISCAGKARARC